MFIILCDFLINMAELAEGHNIVDGSGKSKQYQQLDQVSDRFSQKLWQRSELKSKTDETFHLTCNYFN